MNPCSNDGVLPAPLFSDGATSIPSFSFSRNVTQIVQTPVMLTQPVRELQKVTPAQVQRAQQMRRVHCLRGPQYSFEYQAAFEWLKKTWPLSRGTIVERLITLIQRQDVPAILCQTLLYEMLRKIEHHNPPLLIDIKKAYISIGTGTTPELNAWVAKKWAETTDLSVDQRILTLLHTSPRPDLMNVTTLYALLWKQLGKMVPPLSRMKSAARRQWGDHWVDLKLISWIKSHWLYSKKCSNQEKVVALLRHDGMPAGTSVSILTAGLARVLGNDAPGFDTVARALSEFRKEKPPLPPQHYTAAMSASCCAPLAPYPASASYSSANILSQQAFTTLAGADLTSQQYYEEMNNSDLSAGRTAVLVQPTSAAESSAESCAEEYDWRNDSNLWARVAAVLDRPMLATALTGYSAAQLDCTSAPGGIRDPREDD